MEKQVKYPYKNTKHRNEQDRRYRMKKRLEKIGVSGEQMQATLVEQNPSPDGVVVVLQGARNMMLQNVLREIFQFLSMPRVPETDTINSKRKMLGGIRDQMQIIDKLKVLAKEQSQDHHAEDTQLILEQDNVALMERAQKVLAHLRGEDASEEEDDSQQH